MGLVHKLFSLLDSQQSRAAAALLLLMLIGMVLETFGVGLVVPILALIADPSAMARYPSVQKIMSVTGMAGQAQLVGACMLAMVAVYFVKAFFLAFLAMRQARFVFTLEAALSEKLYSGYLRLPYTFHMQRNSAQLIRNVTGEVGQFASAVMAANVLMSETLVLVGVACLLFAAEPVGAFLVMSALACASGGFYLAAKGRILNWGVARQYHEGQRLQRLQQGLGGIKDVKLYGREDEFSSEYAQHSFASARISEKQNVLNALPRLWLELLAVTGLAVLVFALLWQGKPMSALVPTLGLFAAAAFRLMPSVNRFLVGIQNLRYNLPVVNTLYAEFMLMRQTKDLPADIRPLAFRHGIRLENVFYMYPGSHEAVVVNANLYVPCGKTIGFVGESGSGKSTLIDLVLGLLRPNQGKVTVDEIDIQTNLRAWQNLIGYVPQSIYLTDDTLKRNIAFGVRDAAIDDQAVWRAIDAAQLRDFVESLPDGLETVVGERGVRLSGGQCQRIGIARALYHDPPVLVLDEASSALDTATEVAVMEAINALRGIKTLLIIAHRLSTLAGCDQIYRIEHGVIEKADTISITAP
ncbi:ABC-type multidrug transport system, ATPase and permease component [Formivibrio citricus]|uniref:ABC-type multidrug transport system, ATPase and permease component n=1 Tax=Formivibrio citricus TaxID=83765 RepID=A0A1I4XVG5_9NEIS|nr:ABC transporter ATP-binding protein [Formivibrio citricus]SFN29814.1 ABC-type multidrug transport system, ATPase and permease component [Formivibrio citricus]